MTGSELVAVPDLSLLHDFCHGLLGLRKRYAIIAHPFRVAPNSTIVAISRSAALMG